MKNNRTTNKILISILVIFFVAMFGYCVVTFNNIEETNTVYADQAGVNGAVINDYHTSYTDGANLSNATALNNWLNGTGTEGAKADAYLSDDITLNLTNTTSSAILDGKRLDGCGKTITINVTTSNSLFSTLTLFTILAISLL